MGIDLTTFVLELINFIVLVWILNHFLFRPVMGIMDKRREEIDKGLREAQNLREEADALRVRYEGRLSEWETEKEDARIALNTELAAERATGLESVHRVAEQETRRLAAAEERKRTTWQRLTEQRALKQAAQFAARLLERMAGPELDEKLVELFLADLAALPKDRQELLAGAAKETGGHITITSARVFSPGMKTSLKEALSEKLGIACEADYVTDEAVLSGLRVSIGQWAIQADLNDELAFFTEGSRL